MTRPVPSEIDRARSHPLLERSWQHSVTPPLAVCKHYIAQPSRRATRIRRPGPLEAHRLAFQPHRRQGVAMQQDSKTDGSLVSGRRPTAQVRSILEARRIAKRRPTTVSNAESCTVRCCPNAALTNGSNTRPSFALMKSPCRSSRVTSDTLPNPRFCDAVRTSSPLGPGMWRCTTCPSDCWR